MGPFLFTIDERDEHFLFYFGSHTPTTPLYTRNRGWETRRLPRWEGRPSEDDRDTSPIASTRTDGSGCLHGTCIIVVILCVYLVFSRGNNDERTQPHGTRCNNCLRTFDKSYRDATQSIMSLLHAYPGSKLTVSSPLSPTSSECSATSMLKGG